MQIHYKIQYFMHQVYICSASTRNILAIIFYSMFELCKKVEVYNIENNYYYYDHNAIKSDIKSKLGLHLLNPGPVSSIAVQKTHSKQFSKKGIALSKTIDMISQPRVAKETTPDSKITKTSRNIKILDIEANQLKNKVKDKLQRMRTDTESNQNLINCLYSDQYFATPKNYSSERRRQTSHIQKITTKNKPVYNSVAHENAVPYSSPTLQKLTSSTQAETIKNLSDTRPPISSKIQSCANRDIQLQNIESIDDPQINVPVRQSFENSSSKLITISKSVSSVHETITQRDYRRMDMESDENSRSGKQISINLSNIFSKDDGNSSQFRKSNRETTKRLNLWQDCERHTIQSRFSREAECIEDQDVKVQQSFICDHDPKSNFKIFQCNQIRKKDYIVSQALQNSIGILVSIKQFLSSDFHLIAQQLQIHDQITKALTDPQTSNTILQLYQIQKSQNSYFLIKQPYEISVQARMKQLPNETQKNKLRQKVKKCAINLLEMLEKQQIYSWRKLTIHQFVLCMDEVKIHDVSGFRCAGAEFMGKEDVLAGLDI